MQKQYLKPNELDQKIKSLAWREREILSEVIQAIREIDRRKLYLEFGFANLFTYLTESVGYSAGSAQRRIDAARLANDVPELIQNIESGKIQLTQVSQIQKAIRQVKSTKNIKPTSQEKQNIVNQVLNLPETQSQKQICDFFDLPVLQQQKETIQKNDSFRIEVTLTREQYENLKRAQALLSQSTDSQDLATFINYVSRKIINQKLGKKNQENASCQLAVDQMINNSEGSVLKNESSSSKSIKQDDFIDIKQVTTWHNKSEVKHNKTTRQSELIVANQFSSQIKNRVLSKESQCQFKDPKTGKICGSRWHLQVDHKQSRWAGGASDRMNAQVLCANHNQLKYRQEAFLKMK